MAARVAVVVLNYEGRELLDVVLPSILAQTYGDFDVIVVDDASTDGSAAYVSGRWPQAHVVALERNVGVTAAMNRGVDASDAELVALLNNDLELDRDWLAQMVAALDADPRRAAVTGKLLRFDRRDVIDATGDMLVPSGAALNRGAGEVDRGQYDASTEVFSACGGAALYRASALREVGPFDEALVAYLEDVDWGFRARLQGWTAGYVPGAVAFHMGGATTSRRRGLFGRLQRRNHLAVLLKDHPRPLSALPLALLYQLAWLGASVRDGMAIEHLRAWSGLARMLPGVMRRRRAVQARRRVPASEIDRALRLELPSGRLERVAIQLAPDVVRRRRIRRAAG